MSQNYISEDSLLRTSYAMLTLTTVFVLARIVTTQLVRPKRWLPQDLFIYFAYVVYLVMTVLYIVVTPTMYRLSAVGEGKLEPYAAIQDESLFMIKIFFCNTLLFWVVLWTVKMSFLMLYRKLMEGLQDVYIKLWWVLVVFWFLSFAGNVVSQMTSCSSMKAWFTPGQCGTPRDGRAQIASLYYAYAVDVLTDMMIMILPIRLIWDLQMPRTQKVGVIGLFAIGIVLIAAATLRVAQIGGKTASSSTPSSSWLAVWAVIECSIAVIIGCCPTFVTLIRNHTSPTISYNTQGFVRQRDGENCSGSTPHDVKLNCILTGSNAATSTASKEPAWEDVDGSQFDLVTAPVSRDVVEELEEETPMGRRKIKVRRGAR